MNSRIFPLFAFALALAVFFGYVNPAWTGSITLAKAKLAVDSQARHAASDYKARENELASERNAIDPAGLARLESLLPDSVDNVGLILDLNALAARAGLALSSVDVSKASLASSGSAAVVPTDSGPVGSVDLILSAVGTYGALEQFLTGVESSLRLLDVRSVSVKGSDTGVYAYQIILRLYWLR